MAIIRGVLTYNANIDSLGSEKIEAIASGLQRMYPNAILAVSNSFSGGQAFWGRDELDTPYLSVIVEAETDEKVSKPEYFKHEGFRKALKGALPEASETRYGLVVKVPDSRTRTMLKSSDFTGNLFYLFYNDDTPVNEGNVFPKEFLTFAKGVSTLSYVKDLRIARPQNFHMSVLVEPDMDIKEVLDKISRLHELSSFKAHDSDKNEMFALGHGSSSLALYKNVKPLVLEVTQQ